MEYYGFILREIQILDVVQADTWNYNLKNDFPFELTSVSDLWWGYSEQAFPKWFDQIADLILAR